MIRWCWRVTVILGIFIPDKNKGLMKRYLFILVFVLASFVYVSAQDVVALIQPVVCSSQSSGANVTVPIMPSIVAEDAEHIYRFGSFVVIPTIATRIEGITFDLKKYQPVYDRENNIFVISMPSSKSKILLYTTGGILLREIDTNEEKVTLDADILPSISILYMEFDNQSYSFKLLKGK